MNVDAVMVDKGAALLALALQGVFGWALWSLRRAFVHGDEYLRHIERESQHRQELATRIAALEGRVAQLPDAEALGQLAGAVESLRGDIKALDMRITGVDRLLVRLEGVLDRQETFLRGPLTPPGARR